MCVKFLQKYAGIINWLTASMLEITWSARRTSVQALHWSRIRMQRECCCAADGWVDSIEKMDLCIEKIVFLTYTEILTISLCKPAW